MAKHMRELSSGFAFIMRTQIIITINASNYLHYQSNSCVHSYIISKSVFRALFDSISKVQAIC